MEKLIIASIAAGTAAWLFSKLFTKKEKSACIGCAGNCSKAKALCLTICSALMCAGIAMPAATAQDSVAAQLMNSVNLSGVIEIETSFLDTEENSESDITLATFELAVSAELNEWLNMEAVFLFEEDDTDPPELDTAVINIGNEELSPFYAQLGKTYLPFGNFESIFVSDPVVLEIGETPGTAIVAGAAFNGFNINVSASNSDVPDDEEDNHINNFTASVSFTPELEDIDIALGASWIRDIAASSGLIDAVADSSAGLIEDPVSGWNVWLSANYEGFIFNIEYLAADEFEAGELSFDGAGNDWADSAKPSALNVELGYEATESIVVGLKYENAQDVFDWMTETRYGAVIGCNICTNKECSFDIALEYMHGQYDTEGEPEEDSVVLQTALTF